MKAVRRTPERPYDVRRATCDGRAARRTLLPVATQQAAQDLKTALCQREKCGCQSFWEVAQFVRASNKAFGFGGGSKGDANMFEEIQACLESISLDDVGFNRNHGTAELVDDGPRSRLNYGIRSTQCLNAQLVRQFPGIKGAVAVHGARCPGAAGEPNHSGASRIILLRAFPSHVARRTVVPSHVVRRTVFPSHVARRTSHGFYGN